MAADSENTEEILIDGRIIPVDEYMKIKWVNEYTLGSSAVLVILIFASVFFTRKKLKKLLTIEKTIYESKGEGSSQDGNEFFVPPSKIVAFPDASNADKNVLEQNKEKFIRERSQNMFASITSIRSVDSLSKNVSESFKMDIPGLEPELKDIEIPQVKVVESNGLKWASFTIDAELIFDDDQN